MARHDETIRCSDLPAGAQCPSHLAQSEDVIREFDLPSSPSSEPSRLGASYHEYQQVLHEKGEDAAHGAISVLAAAYAVSERDLAWLVRRIPPSPAEPDDELVEYHLSFALEGCVLSGHLDLGRRFDSLVEIKDWKTGRLDQAPPQLHMQGLAYLCLAVLHYEEQGHEISKGRVAIVMVRQADVRIVDLSREQVDEAWRRVKELAEKMQRMRALPPAQREYGTGDHCTYCPGRRTCPAYRDDMDTALALVAAPVPTGKGARALGQERKGKIKEMVSELLAQDPERGWAAKRMAGELNEALKDAFTEHVEFYGPVPLGVEHEARFMDIMKQPNITPQSASAVVEMVARQIGVDDDLLSTLTVEVNEHLSERAKIPVRQLRRLKKETP